MTKVSEKHLQATIAKRLSDRGYSTRREVLCPGVGACDIVADDWAIEVKPYLTRSAIDKAIGQVMAYSQSLGKKPVIVGLRPQESAWKQAQVTIRRANSLGIEVWDMSTHPVLAGTLVPVSEQTSAQPRLGCFLAQAGGTAIVLSLIVLGIAHKPETVGNVAIQEPTETICIGADGFDGATVRSGPGENYNAIAIVRNGECLPVGISQDGWMFVRLPSGLQGWISDKSISTKGG